MDGGNAQGGAASFQGGANAPPLNETLRTVYSYVLLSGIACESLAVP